MRGIFESVPYHTITKFLTPRLDGQMPLIWTEWVESKLNNVPPPTLVMWFCKSAKLCASFCDNWMLSGVGLNPAAALFPNSVPSNVSMVGVSCGGMVAELPTSGKIKPLSELLLESEV